MLQADSQLVFIRNPLTDGTDGKPLMITLDDTAFAPKPKAFLLVTDVGSPTAPAIVGGIFRIDSGVFELCTAYSASDSLDLVGALNLDNGVVTPIVTGFGSA